MLKNEQLVKFNVATAVKVYRLSEYCWNKMSNQTTAFSHYVLALEDTIVENHEAAERHKEEIKDIFSLDLCQNAVSMARSRGISSKVFAVKEKQEPVFKVKGREFDWILKDIRISKHPVPERFKKVVRDVKDAGIEFERFFIAEPDPTTLPQKKRDPVLLGVIGRWLCEIGRWG